MHQPKLVPFEEGSCRKQTCNILQASVDSLGWTYLRAYWIYFLNNWHGIASKLSSRFTFNSFFSEFSFSQSWRTPGFLSGSRSTVTDCVSCVGMTTDELLMDLKQRNPLTFVPFNICYKILDSKTNTVPFAKINLKGVAEQSSVFASEIFTAISPIPEVIPWNN